MTCEGDPGDRVIDTAILDHQLHHGITVSIRGDSYRLKEKIRAGLLKGTEPRRDPPLAEGGEFSVTTPGEN